MEFDPKERIFLIKGTEVNLLGQKSTINGRLWHQNGIDVIFQSNWYGVDSLKGIEMRISIDGTITYIGLNNAKNPEVTPISAIKRNITDMSTYEYEVKYNNGKNIKSLNITIIFDLVNKLANIKGAEVDKTGKQTELNVDLSVKKTA